MPTPKILVRGKKGGALDFAIQIIPALEKLAEVWSKPRTDEIDTGVEEAGEAVKKNLSKTTPYKTGALWRSQKLERGSKKMEWVITEDVDPPYGLFQRQGVPPSKINPILPKEKEALFWSGARHPVKAVYNHPGIKKNDYWQKAISLSRPEIEKSGDEVAKKIEAVVDI